MRHVISSWCTFLLSIIKIFHRVFKLQSGQEVLRRRRHRRWRQSKRDPSQKQYVPTPLVGGSGGHIYAVKRGCYNYYTIWKAGLKTTKFWKPAKNKKKWKFSNKNSDIFYISAQNIDCRCSLEPPRWGGSNGCPQSMFLSRNKKKIMFTPVNPSFTI